MESAAILAAFGVLFAFILIFVLLFYVYFPLALMTIAKKTKTPNPWLAWIPLVNFYLATKIAKLPINYFIAYLSLAAVYIFLSLGNVNVIFLLLSQVIHFVLSAYVWWKIAQARNYPGWFGLLIMIPVVGLVALGILAWKDKA